MNPNGVFYRTGNIARRVVIPYPELDVLEKKHALKVLMVLRDKKMLNKTELVEEIASGAGSVQARVDDLEAAGLISVEEEAVRPFRKMVSLTEKGKDIADLAARMCDRMEPGSEEIRELAFPHFVVVEDGVHAHLKKVDPFARVGVQTVFLADGLRHFQIFFDAGFVHGQGEVVPA